MSDSRDKNARFPEGSSAALLDAPARFVTAAALYDGHDAAINLVRRGLVQAGAEVIHLGHTRPADEIVKAAIEEDAAAVAVSSYQGGHMEFFLYLRELLDRAGARHVAIFGGGGGVILPSEIEVLEKAGITKVFSPDDGLKLGISGMMQTMVDGARRAARASLEDPGERTGVAALARAITLVELGAAPPLPAEDRGAARAIVLGVTGTGGAGKSSLVDELVLRLTRDFPDLRIGILAVDPSKRKTGGALLGDRLRMNAIYRPEVFLRSFATRQSGTEIAPAAEGAIQLLSAAGYGLVVVETTGIGQGSSAIYDLADLSLYVMTADFGGATQLEKIDMLDFADLVALNKADRRGAEDAVRMVARQVGRGGRQPPPFVGATTASRYNDPGVQALHGALVERLSMRDARFQKDVKDTQAAPPVVIVPSARERYLSEAVEAVRRYKQRTARDVDAMRSFESIQTAAKAIAEDRPAAPAGVLEVLEAARARRQDGLSAALTDLALFEKHAAEYHSGKTSYRVREEDLTVELRRKSLSGTSIPRVALPHWSSRAELLRFVREENLPGYFPFTAGVFPFKREDELPTRQFAGEGTPERTNRRYQLLTDGLASRRLSVAFDSVTLYGCDPDERPDIYGKIGTSGVSIATLDDMRKLFRGFDLLDGKTSVSMTINGPAPIVLAMFFNAAIDQQVERVRGETGREPGPEDLARIRSLVFGSIRGTVQADILKEDQAQNTCILSTNFALKLMGDVQEFFVRKRVRNYYSISISGYHIAEAGANPITQLAFTLANALTYLEFFRFRGLRVDDIAPSFSFFFSNGLDAEYSVLGRVARRLWAVILRDLHGGSDRAQKLKYHVQTSGRSLHAREISFNDIRTTIQALMAVHDNCNSLHTNAYDEAITTPTEESVRRALAIQLIVQKEMGLAMNENPLQGSFIIRELTELVEEAVLSEFERISDRGGVLGAMETGYMRNRIQEESLLYEELKHSGKLPIVGVNVFLDPAAVEGSGGTTPVVRSTEEEKRSQIRNLREFQERHRAQAGPALEKLRRTALSGGNLFDELMETVRFASLGQITATLFEVGGQYRRAL